MADDHTLERYVAMRAICTRHQTAIAGRVTRTALMERARDLGMAARGSVQFVCESELELLLDLAIHTARPGRSRAIDRYRPHGAAEADLRVVDALRRARFSIWSVETIGRAGRIAVSDVLRDEETLLVDVGVAASFRVGGWFASRICWPAEFAMICGVVVPMTPESLEQAEHDCWPWLRGDVDAEAASDPRFAAAVYRNAILAGFMEDVTFREVVAPRAA